VLVKGRDIGVIDPTVWADAAKLMLEYGIVESLPMNLNATLATEVYLGPFVRDSCDSPSRSSGVEEDEEIKKRRRPVCFLVLSLCFFMAPVLHEAYRVAKRRYRDGN
jgi:hypothetical protein